MKAGWKGVAGLALVLGAFGSPVRAQQAPRMADVFDTLQRNQWYLPTADGQARLLVTEMGHGPVVIALHGGPGNDFQYLVDPLRRLTNEYHFVLFDQRGSLLSPVPCDQVDSLTLSKLVEDLETLRIALGQQKVILLGHSFGTLLATAYYRAYPNRVAGLVLAASVPPRTDSAHTFRDYITAMRPRIRALQTRDAVAEALRRAGVSDARDTVSHPWTPQEESLRFKIRLASFNIIDMTRWRDVVGGGVYYNQHVDDAIASTVPEIYDITPTLRAHPIPITVIQGDQDYIDPGASAWSSLAASDGNVRVVVMPHASHYSWVDDPHAFDATLRAGLKRITASLKP